MSDTTTTFGLAEIYHALAVTDVEFRSETIYFVVLDRFATGKPGKNREDDPLFDPDQEEWHKYWGGDLQGLHDRLDYLEQMGISAVWTTPLFEQVQSVTLGEEPRAPIHGYWTSDFKRIHPRWLNDPSEKRLFTRDDTVFDRLLDAMHGRGMKFILDIVCNHSSPRTTDGKGKLYDDGELIADYDNDTNHWYHHYGSIEDWNDEWQVQNRELAGLATFNENNIDFRNHLKQAIKLWIAKGVDALRVDTVKHMPLWFWQEFTADLYTCEANLFCFGEWIYGHPTEQRCVDFANRSGMSILDFGLCDAIRNAMLEDSPQGFLQVKELLDFDGNYSSATELVTFFENHDMPRLQSTGVPDSRMNLAIALLMTTRGIPCLYYGCEQYLHDDTDGGHDPYNRPMMERWEETEAIRIIRILAKERKHNAALIWGSQWPKWVDHDTYVYLRRYRDYRCLVFLNRGPERHIRVEDIEFPDGDYQCRIGGDPVTIRDGAAEVTLPTDSYRVLTVHGEPVDATTVVRLQLNDAPTNPGDRVSVIGDAPELGQWDLRACLPLECVNSNTWFGEIPFNESAGRAIAYKFVIHHADAEAPHRENRTARRRLVPQEGCAKWRDAWEA